MDMQLNEILPGIYHIKFLNQYEITSTFMRLSEFIESSFEEIRGQYFTVEEYMDRYAKEFGNFTYYSDWNGFNLPGEAIRRFFRLFSNVKSRHTHQYLTVKEKNLLKTLYPLLTGKNDFCLIATHREGDLTHETAHGFWYLNIKYQTEMRKLVHKYKYKEEFKALLNKIGYGDQVIEDEIHAYFVEGNKKYLMEKFSFNRKWEIPLEFGKLFEKHKKQQEKIMKEKLDQEEIM